MKRHELDSFDFTSRCQVSENGCWNWIGQLTMNGYGKLKFAGKSTTAHRIAWLKYHGKIPDGMLVCHHCDNKKCINPDHLFVGTSADNNHDMMAKNRHYHGDRHWTKTNPERCPKGDDHPLSKNPSLAARGINYGRFGNPNGTGRGEKNGFSKLKDSDISVIKWKYDHGFSCLELADKHGVTSATIWKVVHGYSWRHLQTA